MVLQSISYFPEVVSYLLFAPAPKSIRQSFRIVAASAAIASDLRHQLSRRWNPVAQPVGATFKNADLVVQFFDEAERDLVLGFAVGRDAIPVSLDLLAGLADTWVSFRWKLHPVVGQFWMAINTHL